MLNHIMPYNEKYKYFLPFLKIPVNRQEGLEILAALGTVVDTGESLGDLSDGYSVEIRQTTDVRGFRS